MGFALIFIGAMLTISAVRGTTGDLAKLVQKDLTGSNSFVFWLVIVLIIGGIGYIPPFRTISRAMLVLILLALFLAKGNPLLPSGGFFQQFNRELSAATGSPTN